MKNTINLNVGPRHLSNNSKSDVPKPEPGSDASKSESELQSTANDPRKKNATNRETVAVQQTQNNGSKLADEDVSNFDLNNLESKKLQHVSVEHVARPSVTRSASSADTASKITEETVIGGTASGSQLCLQW